MMTVMFIGNGFDIAHGINIEFVDFVNSEIFKKKIGVYKKYFKDIEYLKLSKEEKLWSRFEDYCKFVAENNSISRMYFIKKVARIFGEWVIEKEGEIFKDIATTLARKKEYISEIFSSNNVHSVISFNYTTTAQIYGFDRKYFDQYTPRKNYKDISKIKGMCVCLHDYLAKDKKSANQIIGHDKCSGLEKDLLIGTWPGNEKFNPKKEIFKTLCESVEITKLVFFGYSFGDSDDSINSFVEKFCSIPNKSIDIYYVGEPNPNQATVSSKFKNIELKKLSKA